MLASALKTYADALQFYHVSPEDKFENGGAFDFGRTEQRHLVVTRVRLGETLREAVALLGDGGAEALAKLEQMPSGMAAPKKLYAPEVKLGPDPKMGHMESLGSGDIERKREPIWTEDGEEWTPELQRRTIQEMRMGNMRPGRRKKRESDDGT